MQSPIAPALKFGRNRIKILFSECSSKKSEKCYHFSTNTPTSYEHTNIISLLTPLQQICPRGETTLSNCSISACHLKQRNFKRILFQLSESYIFSSVSKYRQFLKKKTHKNHKENHMTRPHSFSRPFSSACYHGMKVQKSQFGIHSSAFYTPNWNNHKRGKSLITINSKENLTPIKTCSCIPDPVGPSSKILLFSSFMSSLGESNTSPPRFS